MPPPCWIVALLAVTGVEKGEATFRPTPAESAVPELFRLPPATFGFELEPIFDSPGFSVAKLRFPSPDQGRSTRAITRSTASISSPRGQESGRRSWFFIYWGPTSPSRGTTRPGWPTRVASSVLEATLLRRAEAGWRRPQRFLSNDVGRSTLSRRQGVCDVRRGASWLAERPEVDPGKLGVTGISLGGIVSAAGGGGRPDLELRGCSSWRAAASTRSSGGWTSPEGPSLSQAMAGFRQDPGRPQAP